MSGEIGSYIGVPVVLDKNLRDGQVVFLPTMPATFRHPGRPAVLYVGTRRPWWCRWRRSRAEYVLARLGRRL